MISAAVQSSVLHLSGGVFLLSHMSRFARNHERIDPTGFFIGACGKCEHNKCR